MADCGGKLVSIEAETIWFEKLRKVIEAGGIANVDLCCE